MLKGVHLTLLMGPVIPIPVPPPVLDGLAGAEVTTSASDRSGFQLRFHFAKNSPIALALLPAGFFDPGIRVILVATVGAIPTVLMDGLITRQDVAPSGDPGKSMLTLTGEDIAVAMDLVDKTGFPWPALPASVNVMAILGEYAMFGIVPLVIPGPFDTPPIPTEKIPTQQGTDYAHIKSLAAKTGYVFYIDPGPLPGMNLAYWGPEIRIGVPQSALNVNLDAETNVESLSFSYNGLQNAQEIALVQEPITKLPIPIPVPDLSLLTPPLAIRPATKLKVKLSNDLAKLTPVEAFARVLGNASRAADAIGASGSLDVLRYGGVLKARGLVSVRGAGIAYDGLYYVKSVTHSIKPGEYKQSFTLARNGLVSLTPAVVP